MKIYGNFKDADNNTVSVSIYNINKTGADININTCDWIEFADDPVEISTDCDDSFVHIIKKKCTIQLKAQRWLGDYLFADNATSIVVNVHRNKNGISTPLFAGYVTPCSYNQDYANAWETITINCVDNLGVIEYRNQNDDKTWTQLKAESKMRTFKELLDKMKLRDTTMIINNLPATNAEVNVAWVTTGFERVVDANGNIVYYAVETQVKELDASTAVTTTNTRLGEELTPEYRDSEDMVVDNGTLYYKKYAWVNVNGTWVQTQDWILGDPVTDGVPVVEDTVNVLDGWSYGALVVPFEYYEHFRIDFVMSDGSVHRGYDDTIGDRIPRAPLQTSNGSFWEYKEADVDDLDYDEETGFYYYKRYAWVMMNYDFRSWQYKTGDWVRGRIYGTVSGKMVQRPTNNGLLPILSMNQRSYVARKDTTTNEFFYDIEYDPNNTQIFFYEPNGNACFENIEELYFNKMNTSNITQMGDTSLNAGLFTDFSNMTILDLTDINTSNVTNIDDMFSGCSSLRSLIVDGVSDTTFDMITSSEAALPTSVRIRRNGLVYTYDTNTNTWIAN